MPSWFLIPLSLELGEGWKGIRDDKPLQVNLVRGSNEVGHGAQCLCPYAIRSEGVEAFVAELRATPHMTFEDAIPVEVAGLPAEQIDAQAEPNSEQPGTDDKVPGSVDILAMRLLHSPGLTDFAWYTESAEARLRFLFVEVGDNTLIIYLEAPPAEFDAFTDLAASVLSSIVVYPR